VASGILPGSSILLLLRLVFDTTALRGASRCASFPLTTIDLLAILC
jgi:hypothetical protein